MDFPKLQGAVKLKTFLRPMLASSVKQPFNDSKWIAEIKYDGYRAMAKTGSSIGLSSRNGISYLKVFPRISKELQKMHFEAVFDGEIVAMDPKSGLPSFNTLQNYSAKSKIPIYFYVFDCLEYKGQDLRSWPLLKRKGILKEHFDCTGIIRYCDHVDGESIVTLFEQVKQIGLEGIVCKRIDSKYRDGDRSRDWVKVKNYQERDFFILGYGIEEFSLLLGEAVDGKLLFRGEVGTGWTDKTRTKLYRLLKNSDGATKSYLTKLPRLKAHWVHPQYMCKVKYLDFTRDGQVRHSVFLSLL